MHDAVRITKIDMDEVRRDDTFEAAHAIYAYLNDTPSSKWGEYFDYAYKNTANTDKRPLRLEGDKIKIIYAEGDNLQSHIDFVKSVVNTANEYSTYSKLN